MSTETVKVGMRPPSVGEFIRDEIIAGFGLTVAEAAGALGVRRATLSDLVNDRAALTPEMALRIELAFGMDMETLLRMQAWADTVAMRTRARDGGYDEIKRRAPPIDSAQKRLAG